MSRFGQVVKRPVRFLAVFPDADYIGDPSQHTGLYAFGEIDALNMLMVPGVTTAPVLAAAIAWCEGRHDVLLIADTPVLLEPLEAVDFRKGQGLYTHAAFNSSYAALYYPWLEISDPLTNRKKLIPPCGAVAGCYARSDDKTHVWYAPAGIDRGRIFNALSLAYKTSRGERDVLYPEGVNVIAVFPDTGLNIWGQRTLQSQPSALDRVNVRRLMMYIEEAIAESSRFVVFEPNHPQTWRALKRLIQPFLQDIKEKGGLYDFAVQCDAETNTPAVIDRNEMVCRIFVKPTRTAEFIELNFVLTTTGADFKEIFTN
jgi:phage tail sheath protein FI